MNCVTNLCKIQDVPINAVFNPYFSEINIISDANIFNKVFKNDKIYLHDLTYIVSNKMSQQLHLNYDEKIYKQINKLNNLNYENFKIKYKYIDYKFNKTPLTDKDNFVLNSLKNKYDREFKRVSNIKQKFINIYFNVSNLKNAHLSLKCKPRKDVTSKLDITEFTNAMCDKTKNIISTNYKNELKNNNINNILLNKSQIGSQYFMTKILVLFNDYLNIITYCLEILNTQPYVSRHIKDCLFNIHEKCEYFYEENNDIYINHMGIFFNASIEKYNIKEDAIFVKLTQRNKNKKNGCTDVWFEKNIQKQPNNNYITNNM